MICEKCGETMHDGSTYCEKCGHSVAVSTTPGELPEKREKVLMGILGALIGALLGGATILLFSAMGRVAALSGLVLAFCTVKGYELLGKKLSKKGIFICLVLILVMPYLANRVDYAIFFSNELGVDFGFAFEHAETLASDDYVTNLVLIYVFSLIGAFGTLRGVFKKK